MKRIVGPSEAAEGLGVSVPRLRRWEAAGKLLTEHTAGGHRRYDLAKLQDSFCAANETGTFRSVRKRIQLPVVGWVRMREPVRFSGILKRVTVSRERLNWLCRNGYSVVMNAGSNVTATGTQRGTLNIWPQALRCQPVERNALARFARTA